VTIIQVQHSVRMNGCINFIYIYASLLFNF
jgi:hypothetical protein